MNVSSELINFAIVNNIAIQEEKVSPLANYLPEGAFEYILPHISDLNLKIKITNARKTKYGDYKAPMLQSNHQITVNGDLNQFHFLITFLHELAHLKTFVQFKNKVKPHGKEWKQHFKELLIFFIGKGIFPLDIKIALSKHLNCIKASTSSDTNLTRILRTYDFEQNIIIEDVPVDSYFKIADGRLFKKGTKRRTRYRCLCIDNKREYLFSPFYQIIPIEQ